MRQGELRQAFRPTLFGALSLALSAKLLAQLAPSIPPRTFRSTGLLLDEIDPQQNISRHFYLAGSLRLVELPKGLTRSFSSTHATALPQVGLLMTRKTQNAALLPEVRRLGPAPSKGAAAHAGKHLFWAQTHKSRKFGTVRSRSPFYAIPMECLPDWTCRAGIALILLTINVGM